jgi:hypothetical protein
MDEEVVEVEEEIGSPGGEVELKRCYLQISFGIFYFSVDTPPFGIGREKLAGSTIITKKRVLICSISRRRIRFQITRQYLIDRYHILPKFQLSYNQLKLS